MATRSKSPAGRLIAVGVLTLLLCLGVVLLYVGWEPFTHRVEGFSLSRTGYVGMALGLVAALVLGAGLTALILSRKRKHKD